MWYSFAISETVTHGPKSSALWYAKGKRNDAIEDNYSGHVAHADTVVMSGTESTLSSRGYRWRYDRKLVAVKPGTVFATCVIDCGIFRVQNSRR